MAIKALPTETTRLLNSSLVITTPEILIKELCENSLDAHATSIEIQISTNTIDRVHVRDNGHGISPDDFDTLGRRSHTSKLMTFDELAKKGGSSFGFRGEALASANTCGRVTITTRTHNEKVANTLILKPKCGGVADRRPAPGLVGTTVTVTRLFQEFPVRRQQFIKDSGKTLVKIKEVLVRLAMAHPSVKLNFKVMGNQQADYLFSPSKSHSVKEVTLQTFGKQLATECSYHEISRDCYSIEAFLPTSKATVTNVSSKGAFCSVDSRPLDPSRGTMKKILKLFKQSISKHMGDVQRPFFQADIRCPPESYDINVDILKLEVVFSNEALLLDLFAEIFERVYGGSCEPRNSTVPRQMTPVPNVTPTITAEPIATKIKQETITPQQDTSKYPTNVIILDSESESGSDLDSDMIAVQFEDDLPQLLPASTPPTSSTGNLTSEPTMCDALGDAGEQTVSVMTSWQVNMADVPDAEEMSTDLRTENVKVAVMDTAAVTCNPDPIPEAPRVSINPSSALPESSNAAAPRSPMLERQKARSPQTPNQRLERVEYQSDFLGGDITPNPTPESPIRTNQAPPASFRQIVITDAPSTPQRPPITRTYATPISSLTRPGSIMTTLQQVNSPFQRFTFGMVHRTDDAPPPSNPSVSQLDSTAELRRLDGLKQMQLSFNRQTGFRPFNAPIVTSPPLPEGLRSTNNPALLAPSQSSSPAVFSHQQQLSHRVNATPEFEAENILDAMCTQSPSPPLLSEHRPKIMRECFRKTTCCRTPSVPKRPAPTVYQISSENSDDSSDNEPRSRSIRASKRRRIVSDDTSPSPQSLPMACRSSWRMSRVLSRELRDLALEKIPESDRTQDLMLSVQTSVGLLCDWHDQAKMRDGYIAGEGEEFFMAEYVEAEEEFHGLEKRVYAILEGWGDGSMAKRLEGCVNLKGMLEKGI